MLNSGQITRPGALVTPLALQRKANVNVTLCRGRQLPAQLVDLIDYLGDPTVRVVQNLLSAHLRLSHHDLRLLLGLIADLVDGALGGEHRLAQGLLAVLVLLELSLKAAYVVSMLTAAM